MRNAILQFFGTDPLVAWILVAAALFVIAAIALLVRAWLQERRDRRRDEQFMARMRAHLGPVEWPSKPGPKGGDWRNRRAS